MSQIVLLAEDDPTVRKFIITSLEREDFIVFPASNGTEALQVCRNVVQIDLLLTDVRMDDHLTGIELAERIKKARAATKVLVMSGFLETEAVALEKGFPFLRKPFTHAVLVQRVREVLSDIAALPKRR